MTERVDELRPEAEKDGVAGSARFQRRVGSGNPIVVVEFLILICCKGRRAIVDIQQDGIEAVRCVLQGTADVLHQDSKSRILQRVACQRCQGTGGVPIDDGRHQLGHHDGGVRGQQVQGSAQGKAHAQSAHENSWFPAIGNGRARGQSQFVTGVRRCLRRCL